jgi:hypothetical protein
MSCTHQPDGVTVVGDPSAPAREREENDMSTTVTGLSADHLSHTWSTLVLSTSRVDRS